MQCEKVNHTKLNVENISEKSEITYTMGDFLGNSNAQRFFRRAKILPFYESEYRLEDEVFVEYNKTGLN